ncbi:MAG: hypothetical protein WAO00_04370 [Chthoniobacterales bacterium]
MASETNITAIILGGALALAGTIVSQAMGLLSGWVDRRHKRDLRQRERLERMVDLITATIPWFQKLGVSHSLEELRDAQPPPEARQVAMLASLYFPALVEPARNYVNALIRYYHFATDCFQPGHPASVGAQMALIYTKDPEANARNTEPLVVRQALDDAIAKEAKKYAHI